MTPTPRVKLTTNLGDITIELDSQKAPISAQNFVTYVKEGFYNNTLFHRVIPGFMIQGGGFSTDFVQKKGVEPIKNEADNGLKNVRGSIAMARTADPHSASSQFFINLIDNGFLNFSSPTQQGWGYTVFGQVIEGMDIVDKIAKQATDSQKGHADVPVENVVIESAEIVE